LSIKIADAYISVTTEKGGLDAALNGSLSGVSAWSVTLGGLLKDAIEGVVGLAESAGKAIVGFLTDSVDKAANFEQKMADVRAAMGLTVEETQKLSDLAVNLGLDPTLKVTTLEAADAIKLLGKNGLDTTQILDGAADATVRLSNATGGDFKTAASTATQVMNIWGLSGKDMAGVVDSITGVVNNSKASLNDYRLSVSQGGFAAVAAGLNFRDFNTMLTQNMDAAGSAAQAGTMLRMFLQSLTPDTKAAASAMRELGLYHGSTSAEAEKAQESLGKVNEKIALLDPASKNYAKQLAVLTTEQSALQATVNQGSNAFYDMNGNLKSGAEITQILHEATAGLNDEERATLLTTIFHSRGMQFAADVATHTAAEFNALSAEVNKNGNAMESGAIRMATYKGAMEILGGVVEAFQIKLGQPMLGALQRLDLALGQALGTQKSAEIVGFFTQVGNRIASFIDNALNPMAQKWLPLIIDALIRLGSTLLGVIPSNDTLKAALDALGRKIVEFIDWLGRVVIGFKDFITWVGNAYEKTKSFIQPIVDVIAKFVSWKDVITVVIAALGLLIAPIVSVMSQLALVVVAVSTLRHAWETDFGGIKSYTVQVADEIMKTLKFLTGGWTDETNAWGRIVKNLTATISAEIKIIVGTLTGLVSITMALIRGDWQRAWELSQKIAKDNGDAIVTIGGKTLDNLKILFVDKGPPTGKALPDGLKKGIDAGLPDVKTSVEKLGSGAIDSWQLKLQSRSPSLVFAGLGRDLVNGLIQGLQDGMNALIAKITQMANDAINAVKNAFSGANFAGIGSSIASGISSGIAAGTSAVTSAATAVIDAAKNAANAAAAIKSPSRVFSEQVGLPIAQGIGKGILSGMRDVAEQMASSIKGLLPNTGGLLGSSGQLVSNASNGMNLSGLADMLSGLVGRVGNGGGVTINQNFYFASGGMGNLAAVANAAGSSTKDALRQVGYR
jgi:TP901 family phage tail tape measure protein